MADIIARDREESRPRPPDEATDIIELLFFAYRDFISDPDAILAKAQRQKTSDPRH